MNEVVYEVEKVESNVKRIKIYAERLLVKQEMKTEDSMEEN